MNLEDFNKKAQTSKKDNQQFYRRLKNKSPKNLDDLFHENHKNVFETTDCLTCANCCKTTSPIFYPRDIERASKPLKLKPGEFSQKYLLIDEDNDFVLKQSPCPFLAANNSCGIYEYRPNACREYPHTSRKKMSQILDLTYRNTLICLAVLKITEALKKQLQV